MNLINSPILGAKVSLHFFTPKPKAIIKNPHNNSHITMMLKKRVNSDESNKLTTTTTEFDDSLESSTTTTTTTKPCLCGRRHFIEATATTLTAATQSATATNSDSEYTALVNKFHPPKPDWYQKFFAWVLNSFTKSYEAEVARYKSQIFSILKEKKANKILEIGIGTGPNLNYYASDSNVQVVGIDPNPEMEKYARSSATSAGFPLSNFEFIHAVGEVIPLSDASVDAVVGTLVLCSVKDVDLTLKDGTFLRFLQGVLDPLQQTIADGCHLSRETGESIAKAGFSSVELDMAILSNATFVNPHVYGIAKK
ncbi:uncharacterized protein LOC127119487 isoform X2 [Lathyrus oleraceus]|uniref:uncharacterized protein LOC127119487 isoform X2 n=1 Tax=Pisum sativum TaxID=3888 RepID=UPI0021D0C876|nr:uncharacterized protein LOC127119487 isoform X2 [Pisum sativum]